MPQSYKVKRCEWCGLETNRIRCNVCQGPVREVTVSTEAPADEPCGTCNGAGSGHYQGQIGSEPTPQEFLEALWACTAEWMRVLKPSGSIFVNLGDKYSGAQAQNIGGANRAGDSARSGGSAKVAKQICAGCADRIPCLQYALDHGERFGVWGGMSERDRRRLEKQAA